VVTTHDELAVSWTAEEAREKVETLLRTRSEDEARARFRLCSQDQWQYQRFMRELADGRWRGEIVRLLYRPFDVRWTVWNRNVAVHRRERASAHMLGGKNQALVTVRQVPEGVYDHVLVTRHPVDNRATVSNKGTAFLMPLYLYDDAGHRRPNLATAFVDELASRIGMRFTAERTTGEALSADDVFHYLYAVLSSPSYRARYADFLRADFARVPLPGSAAVFRDLRDAGERLSAVQLSERSAPAIARAPQRGSNVVEGVGYRPAGSHRATGAVAINSTQEFGDVPEAVWNFSIGGYRVCRKWLKDRKGRRLGEEDIAWYLSIVAIVAQTIREMAEIDAVIARHGGWPAAFHS
jgi:predicted helicase